MKRLLIGLTALLAALAPGPGAADGSDVFSLKIRGLTVGVVYLTHSSDARRYAVAGVIENTGLTRLFRTFSYRGSSTGRVDGGQLRPRRYQEQADTGRRKSDAVIEYVGGVPRVLRYASPVEPGPDSPDPATQGGTVDPLTAIFALLRDVPRDRACQLDTAIFDGRRRSSIRMHPVAATGGLPRCAGRYERLQGFTAEEVSRHRYFDFTLTYGDAGNGMLRVEDVSFASFYGTASIDRR